MKRYSFLSLFIFLLMGCSFNGIMSESYDGEKIMPDEEAVELFEEENKLKTEGLEERYAFLNSNTVFDGIADGGEEVELSPGSYSVGEDIEPGRYIAHAADASALVVYDEADVRILEVALNFVTTSAVLELQEGYRIEYKARRDSVTLVPTEEKFEETIPAGIHSVGENIERGTYDLITRELPVRRLNSQDEVYMNTDGYTPSLLMYSNVEEDTESSGLSIELNEGDTIITEYMVVLKKR